MKANPKTAATVGSAFFFYSTEFIRYDKTPVEFSDAGGPRDRWWKAKNTSCLLSEAPRKTGNDIGKGIEREKGVKRSLGMCMLSNTRKHPGLLLLVEHQTWTMFLIYGWVLGFSMLNPSEVAIVSRLRS